MVRLTDEFPGIAHTILAVKNQADLWVDNTLNDQLSSFWNIDADHNGMHSFSDVFLAEQRSWEVAVGNTHPYPNKMAPTNLCWSPSIFPEARLQYDNIRLEIFLRVINEVNDLSFVFVSAVQLDADGQQDQVDGDEAGDDGKCHWILRQSEIMMDFLLN